MRGGRIIACGAVNRESAFKNVVCDFVGDGTTWLQSSQRTFKRFQFKVLPCEFINVWTHELRVATESQPRKFGTQSFPLNFHSEGKKESLAVKESLLRHHFKFRPLSICIDTSNKPRVTYRPTPGCWHIPFNFLTSFSPAIRTPAWGFDRYEPSCCSHT